MKLILLGPPGAGKGTQANYIKEEFNIPQISTGDILRAEVRAGTEHGKELKKIMDAGELVSDDLILEIIKTRVYEKDCKNGYLFDGFPRTVAQAEGMKANHIEMDCVVELQVNDSEIVKRMSGRRVHMQSGRSYHLLYNPPRHDGLDDETGEPLVQRDDDKEETVIKRLKIYHSQTSPLIRYYSDWSQNTSQNAPEYFQIDGSQEVEVIRNNIILLLNNLK
ncbi:MAG: adenylate kinase [Gammaproteobacteria bacterium]|jgi:adenylate kinase